MINNIIDISMVDEGFTKLQLRNVEVISFIEEICYSVIPYARSKNIELIFDTDEEELIMCIDLDKMERVILNLLSNSIKYTQENGSIDVNISKIDNNIHISVSDNGIGIDGENIEVIFNKFIQIEDTMTRSNEGSGIGLSLVKSFVNLHKGEIYVSSELGVGSTFTVVIPISVDENDEYTTFKCKSSCTMNADIELSDIN